MEVESALDVVAVESEINGIDTSEFKVGDILVFDGMGPYTAKKGAKAIYEGSFEQWGEEWIKVKWIDDKANGQEDGGYSAYNFTKVD